jgi:hypothetical protein
VAPGWTNDLEAGPSPGSSWVRPGTVSGLWVARPVCSRSLGQARSCVHPFGVPAAGGRGGMGRARVRAAGSDHPLNAVTCGNGMRKHDLGTHRA